MTHENKAGQPADVEPQDEIEKALSSLSLAERESLRDALSEAENARHGAFPESKESSRLLEFIRKSRAAGTHGRAAVVLRRSGVSLANNPHQGLRLAASELTDPPAARTVTYQLLLRAPDQGMEFFTDVEGRVVMRAEQPKEVLVVDGEPYQVRPIPSSGNLHEVVGLESGDLLDWCRDEYDS